MLLELRLHIYRQLLFPTKLISMSPTIAPPEDSEEEADEDWIDEDSEGPDTEDELEEMLYGPREYTRESEPNPFTREDFDLFKRHPAILRTNRQIYFEASAVLYSEAVIDFCPGEIFCLRKKPRDLPFGVRSPNPWRHNPLHGTGRQEGVNVIYDTPAMYGCMEPHVFARFQHFSFDGFFDYEHTQHIELWIDDDTHVIRREDAVAYQAILKSSRLMKDLVKILANCRQIMELDICIEVDVMANSNLLMGEVPEDIDDEEAEVADAKADRLMDIASEKATELFLDSKICDPLKKLVNVKTFNMKFGFEDREENERYEPPRKYVDLLKSMKTHIEGNFKEPISV